MAEEKKSENQAVKEEAPKRPAQPKAASKYVVAAGKAISLAGRLRLEGDEIKAGEVTDLEALVKGGYIEKA